jgi:hypothetical protein
MRVTDLDERTIRDAVEVLSGASISDPDRPRRVRTYAAGRVLVDLHAREVYSYGRHFPLFRYVPKSRRHPAVFVLNGDEWRGPNSRTRDHQESARRAVADSGIASVVIPFTALDGAGIDLDSIRPLHVREDARWTEEHELTGDAPDLDDLESADSCEERDERSETDYQGRPCASHGTWSRVYTWRRGGRRYSRSIYRQAFVHTGERTPAGYPIGEWRSSDSWSAPVSSHAYLDGNHELVRGDDGRWRFITHEHRLGDALFSAVRAIREPTRPALPFESEHENERETVQLGDGNGRTYCAENVGETAAGERRSGRHEAGPSGACVHCGAPLFADVVWRRRSRYLSSFDYQELWPLYFLCEVPRGAGPTVETALDALAPRAVHAALARGRDVERQGDVFFVASDLTREELAARGATFARLTLWTRDAKSRPGEVGYRPAPTAADRRRELAFRRREWRRRFRLALADARAPVTERGARLRWRKMRERHAAEVAEARAELRRLVFADAYRQAPSWTSDPRGTELRQRVGEIKSARRRLEALLATGPRDAYGYTSRAHARDAYRRRIGDTARGAWTEAGAVALERFRPYEYGASQAFARRRQQVRRALAIYGTAHSATEVARTRDGAVYARGIVRHVPDLDSGRGGDRDHRARQLGDGARWYLAVRNTVPRQVTRRSRRRSTAGTMPAGR